jgi:hypothetical protein
MAGAKAKTLVTLRKLGTNLFLLVPLPGCTASAPTPQIVSSTAQPLQLMNHAATAISVEEKGSTSVVVSGFLPQQLPISGSSGAAGAGTASDRLVIIGAKRAMVRLFIDSMGSTAQLVPAATLGIPIVAISRSANDRLEIATVDGTRWIGMDDVVTEGGPRASGG